MPDDLIVNSGLEGEIVSHTKRMHGVTEAQHRQKTWTRS